MKTKVYRNLDRPFTLLGIKGRYIAVAGCALLAILMVSLLVGSLAGTFAGLASALVLTSGGYLGLAEFQQHFPPKTLDRRLNGLGMPRFILGRSATWKR